MPVEQVGRALKASVKTLLVNLVCKPRPKVLVFVEGPHAVEFLRRIAAILHAADAKLPRSRRHGASARTGVRVLWREKLLKIGAKVTRHSKYVTFQLAEVAVPRQLFAAILKRIGRLAMQPALCPSG
jgi:hypothetical protein